ncbi:MAG: peptidase M23 [Rhodobacterales bacterium]|nr:MAG: peptidase M23 [Rhodobacterales bacterium]
MAGQSGRASPAESAAAAIEALRAAQVSLEMAEGRRGRVAALTETVRAYEAGLAALREGLRQAAIRERAIKDSFAAENDRLARLLGVLQTIQSAPDTSLLLHPEGPLGTVRSGMLVAHVTPALAREAEALRLQLEEVTALRALQEEALGTLEEGLRGVQDARTELSRAIANRTDLPNRLVTDPQAMASLLRSADTLESFAGGLAGTGFVDETVPVETTDFTAARGQLDMPVFGRVIRRAGEADAAGVRRPGWVVATRPLTLVTTPWPATIRYLGPLLDFGEVAVLEPGEGYFLVLAGLGQLFGKVGEVLPKGAAVGLMGGTAMGADQAFLMSVAEGGGAEATETLYIELRRNGEPLDPGEWFTEAD